MNFDDVNLYDDLLGAGDDELDAAPFGIIGLADDHRAVSYNRAESELSGLSTERVLGRHFFTEVAPCTNNYMVAQRFETEAELDATIDYVFTLRMKPTPVTLRLLRRPGARRQFLLVQRS